jgi:hypothetical protein
MSRQLLLFIYRYLLFLYPRSYRIYFSAEMEDVFRQSISDSALKGHSSLMRVIMRELSTLPLSALKEHTSKFDSRNTILSNSVQGRRRSISPRELTATLAAFAFPLILMVLNNMLASETSVAVALVFLGLVIIPGLFMGTPRWCLPYLGLAVSIFSFMIIFNWLTESILPTVPPWLGPGPMEQSTRLLWQALLTGMMWFSLFLVILSLWLALAFVRWLRRQEWPLFQGDWTQFSFILYGTSMTALVLLLDDYLYQETLIIICLLCLAVGAWYYLHSSIPWQRLLALAGGVTASLAVAAAGLWVLAPLQSRSLAGSWNTPETERLFEAWRVMLVWASLMFFLLFPGIVRFLIPAARPSNISDRDRDEPAVC